MSTKYFQDAPELREAIPLQLENMFASYIHQLAPTKISQTQTSSNFHKLQRDNTGEIEKNLPSPSQAFYSTSKDFRKMNSTDKISAIPTKRGSIIFQSSPKTSYREGKEVRSKDYQQQSLRGSHGNIAYLKELTTPSKDAFKCTNIHTIRSIKQKKEVSSQLTSSTNYASVADFGKEESKQRGGWISTKDIEEQDAFLYDQKKTRGSLVFYEKEKPKGLDSPKMVPVHKGIGISFTPKIPKKLAENFPSLSRKGIKFAKTQINGENLNKFLQIRSPKQGKTTILKTENDSEKKKEIFVLDQHKTEATNIQSYQKLSPSHQMDLPKNSPKYKGLRIELPDNTRDPSIESQKSENEKIGSHYENRMMRPGNILKSRKGNRLFISIASPTFSKTETRESRKAKENQDFQQRMVKEFFSPVAVKDKAKQQQSTFESTKCGLGSTACSSAKLMKASVNTEKEIENKRGNVNDSAVEDLLEMMGVKEEDENEDWSFLEQKNEVLGRSFIDFEGQN